MTSSRHSRPAERTPPSGLTPIEFMIVLFVVGALVYAVLLTGDRSTARFDTTRVTVRSGDTLWSIAERHPLKGCTTEQTAAVLGEINGLDDSAIIAGSAIDVPAPHDSDALLAMR